MRVITRKRLLEFSVLHPNAREALVAWAKVIERHSPNNFAEMRRLFNAVDKVGRFHVFNICGNRYRLVCGVSYSTQQCFVKHVLTHREYDQGHWL